MLSSSHNVIIGAGQLSLAIMDELLARGRQVTLVNRSGRVAEALPAGVIVRRADATRPDEVAAVTAGAEVVFHSAQPEYHQWPELFPPITAGIIAGVARSGARLVAVDNLYMYGPTAGAPLTEDLPYAAAGKKGRTRAQIAEMLLAAHREGRVRVAIGRASDFYGPRVTGSALGDRVFRNALARKPIDLLGDLDVPHTYTYVRDFAHSLVTLSEHAQAFGRAWHVPSAPTLTTRQFIALLERELGRPVRVRVAGRVMLTLAGLFVPILAEFKEMLYEFSEPFVVDHGRYEQAFGALVTPHDIAIRETLAWYQAQMETSISLAAAPLAA